MHFTLSTAFDIRKYYRDLLKDSPLYPGSEIPIHGFFVCYMNDAESVKEMLVQSRKEDFLWGIEVNDEEKTNNVYEVYGYHYIDYELVYWELDKYLTDRKIEKIYL